MNLQRYLLATLIIGVLAACSGDTTDGAPPTQPTEQLSEAETNAALSDLGGEMLSAVFSMQGSSSSAALQQLPVHAANFPLQESSEGAALPRGRYVYNEAADAWQLRGDSDDLVLTWAYSGVDAQAEATLTLDWDAGADTVSVAGPEGETLEVPTAFNFNLVAAEQEVADVDLALSYYNSAECGADAGIAEPTSLSVNGAGSLLDLEVGYSVAEEDGVDTVTTQGEVTLKHGEGAVLEWNVNVSGEREREGCFTSDYAPTSGSVDVSLVSDAGSFALGFDVDSVDLENESVALSEGTLQIGGQLAVSFEGTLDDANGNGVPGENVILSFADGETVTLEQILQRSKVGLMLRGLGAGR